MNSCPGSVIVLFLMFGKPNAQKLVVFRFIILEAFDHDFLQVVKLQIRTSVTRTIIVIFFVSSGRSSGDSVTQAQGQLTLTEGASLNVSCIYSSSSYPTLFWYVQYPGEGPQPLLKATRSGDKASNQGFKATYRKEPNSFNLEKASVQESDSADCKTCDL